MKTAEKTKEETYTCPKCHTTIKSSIKLDYCVCGGRYNALNDFFTDVLGVDLKRRNK